MLFWTRKYPCRWVLIVVVVCFSYLFEAWRRPETSLLIILRLLLKFDLPSLHAPILSFKCDTRKQDDDQHDKAESCNKDYQKYSPCRHYWLAHWSAWCAIVQRHITAIVGASIISKAHLSTCKSNPWFIRVVLFIAQILR